MKKIENPIEKVEMYQNIINLFQKNTTLTSLGDFNKGLAKLIDNQAELDVLLVIYKKDITAILQNKEISKKELAQLLHQVAGILKLSAFARKNKKLEKKLDFLPKDLELTSDKKLIKQAQKILFMVNKIGGYSIANMLNISIKQLNKKSQNAKQLSDEFGLTPSKIKQLEDSNNVFMQNIILADKEADNMKEALKDIRKICKKNDSLLKKKMDKFVAVYEKPGSSFLKAYAKLRAKKEETEKEK